MVCYFFKKQKIDNKGMTFVELIVVLGIFAAISSTVLFNYRDFSSNVALQNLAQDIALQIKRAQTDAVSGKLPTFSQGGDQSLNPALVPLDWTPSYGLAFWLDESSSWSLGGKGFVYYFNKYAMPIDPPFDRDFYDFTQSPYNGCGSLADSESECLEEIRINSGDYIDLICFDFAVIDDTCSTGINAQDLSNQVFISFTRPRGNAVILDGSVDDGTTASTHSNVYLRLVSSSGTRKFLAVWSTGYISIR
jgi:prepilin-type N-terminal cleavage/methylation domain-containing protein